MNGFSKYQLLKRQKVNKDKELQKKFILYCLRAGIPKTNIGEFLGYTRAGIKYYVERNDLNEVCPLRGEECSFKTLSELPDYEKNAILDLLNFVPADIVSSWLKICFRYNRCSRNKKTPFLQGAERRGQVIFYLD